MNLWKLGVVWLRVGLFGFGGGPAFVPLIREECVERQGWLTDAEFLDALAFGNALPGPISHKLAAHVGLKVAGWPGAAVALVAVTAPGVALMALAMGVYLRYRESPVMAGVLRAIRPAVVGLLAYTAWSLAPDAARDRVGIAIGVAAFAALALDVHPAIVMGVAIGVGAFILPGW